VAILGVESRGPAGVDLATMIEVTPQYAKHTQQNTPHFAFYRGLGASPQEI